MAKRLPEQLTELSVRAKSVEDTFALHKERPRCAAHQASRKADPD